MRSKATASIARAYSLNKVEKAEDDDLISVGFISPTLSFEADLYVDDLVDIMIDHVPSYREFIAAIELFVPLGSASGKYSGTGWNFWFVRGARAPDTLI